MSAKPWLRDYFKRLAENIERDEIISERALSATVELPLKGWSRGKTLLEALEYDKEYVHPQYPIQIGTSKPRVDFLLGKDSNKWMLDLKKPGEACDRSKHVGQLQSYLGQEKIALGVLFSGTWALAYVNPEHPFVNDLCNAITDNTLAQIPALDLRNYPCVKVSMSSGDTRDMVRFFQMVRFDNGMPGIKDLARKLAGDYIKRVRNEGKASVRVAEITTIVKKMLQSPDETFFESIITSSPELSKLRPTSKEIAEVWSVVTKNS